jgi:hypothetical protein
MQLDDFLLYASPQEYRFGVEVIKNCAAFSFLLLTLFATSASAYTINGMFARLISCDFSYSFVRGESGYTGTYEVLGEFWTVYFGSYYCEP